MSEWDAFPVAGNAPAAAAEAGSGTSPSLDARSRDMLIRTVLGEAGSEPDAGQAAVAAVIRNRLQSGKWGDNIPRVVLAKSQFEPWGTAEGRARMTGYKPDSPEYQRAAANVDRAWNGEDPTQGATHFFSPSAQAALGRQAPAWAQGEPQMIGRHAFYAPDGRAPATEVSAARRAPADDPWSAFPAAQPSGDGSNPLRITVTPGNNSEALPADTGGQFASTPGQNFRTAREGQSPPVATPGEAAKAGFFRGATFNFIDELKALAEAGGVDPNDPDGLTAAIGLIKGAYGKATGNPEVEAGYRAAVSRERETAQRMQEQQPGASIMGEIGGAAATLPMGGFAARGTGLGARTLAGAQTGAVYGALGGAGEGTDMASRVTGAGVGGAVGAGIGAAATPIVEGVVQGARALGAPVANTIRGIRDPEGEAARRVAIALQRDFRTAGGAPGLTAPEFAASRAAGGPAAIIDLGGETTRGLARSAANTSPEARQALNNTINNRFESQSDRVTGWLNQTFGPSDTGATREALQQAARVANRPAYARAYNDRAAQSLWDEGFEQVAQAPVVQDAIRNATRTGANRAAADGWTPIRNPFRFDADSQRMVLADPNVRPNLQFWDHVKRNLDDTVTRLQRQGENSAARDAIQLRAYLVNHLDELVPSFATARAGAARFFGANDALEAGERFLTSNAPIADARRAFVQMSGPERTLFREGFVQSLVQKIESTGDRRSVLNAIAQSPRAQQQIELAMGPQRAREFEAMMRVEGIMDLARGAVQGNSTTARQLAELGLAGGAYGIGTGLNPFNPSPGALAGAALVWGAARGRNVINQRVAQRVGEMLASNDPAVLRRGVQIVSRSQNMLNALRAFDQGAARLGIGQAPVPSPVQAAGVGRAEGDQPDVPRPPGQ